MYFERCVCEEFLYFVQLFLYRLLRGVTDMFFFCFVGVVFIHLISSMAIDVVLQFVCMYISCAELGATHSVLGRQYAMLHVRRALITRAEGLKCDLLPELDTLLLSRVNVGSNTLNPLRLSDVNWTILDVSVRVMGGPDVYTILQARLKRFVKDPTYSRGLNYYA